MVCCAFFLAGLSAQRWYSWGPAQEQCRLCNFCMVYWRKYGGLKLPTKWGRLSFSEVWRRKARDTADGGMYVFPSFSVLLSFRDE